MQYKSISVKREHEVYFQNIFLPYEGQEDETLNKSNCTRELRY